MSYRVEKIVQLIQNGEGISLEFKRTLTSSRRIARVLVSFANTSGGTLLIGVEDDGSITGVSSELKELEKLEVAVRDFVSEDLSISYSVVEVDGCKVMQVGVAESKKKPVAVVNQKGERIFYVRVKDKAVPTQRLTTLAGAPKELDGLKEARQVKTLFMYLRANDDITAKEYAKLINFSERRTVHLLNKLVETGYLLMREVAGRKGYSLRVLPST
jgi:predicted HTH transcriptional regulator